MPIETIRWNRALFTGKKGYYILEFSDLEDGSVSVQATGPIPVDDAVAWTSVVASGTGKTMAEARRLVVEKLTAMGA